MSIEQFLELNELEKLCAIMENGRLIAQRHKKETRVFLYRLESFYVSACYVVANDQLSEITAYIDTDQTVPHFRKYLISIHPAERHYDTPELD